MTSIKRFIKDESGATAIEYALIAVGIALAVAAGASALGTQISNLFSRIGTALSGVTPVVPGQ